MVGSIEDITKKRNLNLSLLNFYNYWLFNCRDIFYFIFIMHYYTKLPEAYSLVRPIVDVLPAIPVERRLNKLPWL